MEQSTCIVRDCVKEPKFTCSCDPGVPICLKHIYWHLRSSNFPSKLHSFNELNNSQTSPREIAIAFLENYKADIKKLKELHFIDEIAKSNRINSNLNIFQSKLNKEANSIESLRKRIINCDDSWLEQSPNLMIRKLAKKVNKYLFLYCDGPALSIENDFKASVQDKKYYRKQESSILSIEKALPIIIQSKQTQKTKNYLYLSTNMKKIFIPIFILILSIICWSPDFISKKPLRNSGTPEDISSIFEHTKEQIASLSIDPQNYLIVKEIFGNLMLINDFFSREPRELESSTLGSSECKIISHEHKVFYRKFYNSYFYGYWNVVYKGKGIYISDIREGETYYFGINFFENGEKYVRYFTAGDKESLDGLYFWNNDEWYFGKWYTGYAHYNGFYYNKNETYKGEIEYSQLKGKGQHTWSNGSVIDGKILNGLWTGNGTLTFPNGDIYQGLFKDSKADGYGKYVWNSTKVSYEGVFSNGFRKDQSKWYRNCKGNVIAGKQVLGGTIKIEFDTNDEECKFTTILDDIGKIINIDADIITLPFNKNRPVIRNRPS